MTLQKLAQLTPGRLGRIVAVDTGAETQNRLAALGLVPGEVIELLRATPNGPYVIAFRQSRLALQWELAQGISVRAL
jgi:Fe2+ transport system protein FeoA